MFYWTAEWMFRSTSLVNIIKTLYELWSVSSQNQHNINTFCFSSLTLPCYHNHFELNCNEISALSCYLKLQFRRKCYWLHVFVGISVFLILSSFGLESFRFLISEVKIFIEDIKCCWKWRMSPVYQVLFICVCGHLLICKDYKSEPCDMVRNCRFKLKKINVSFFVSN